MILSLVICGLEHSGTTLVSDLFRQVPNLDSGFECGALLCDNPRDFVKLEPFAKNMLKGWGIDQATFEKCCDVDTFEELYDNLLNYSTILPQNTTNIFDKTPRYLSKLSHLSKKCACPIIVTHKDPRATIYSDFRRAQATDFDQWYRDYMPKKMGYMTTCYKEYLESIANPQITSISLEDLAMNLRDTLERMFEHSGYAFDLKYTILGNNRYKNTKGKSISSEIVFEYFNNISQSHIKKIENDFCKFDKWFYE